MKYLCLAYGGGREWEALSTIERDAITTECLTIDEEFRKSAQLITYAGLKWAATTVRLRSGRLAVTDGPFVETKEQVGGYFVIDARDLNEAIRVASTHPAARMGEQLGWGIEVRQIEDFGQAEGRATGVA